MTRAAKLNLILTVVSVTISSLAVLVPAIWMLSGHLKTIEQKQENTCEKVDKIERKFDAFIDRSSKKEQEIFIRETKLEVNVKRLMEEVRDLKKNRRNG